MSQDEKSLSERVLVLMPTTLDAERTALLLSEAGLRSTICEDLAALCREARAQRCSLTKLSLPAALGVCPS